MSWINNARDVPLFANSGTVPSMYDTIIDWFQPMTFGVITKTVEAFQLVEDVTNVSFHGVIQPLTGRQIAMKPEGQRQWDWIMLHSELSLKLEIDDIIIYLGKQYRVQNDKDYSLYKYRYYELVSDWEGSGPPSP